MTNPLLEDSPLPPFSQISTEQVEPAIKTLINRGKTAIEKLLAANSTFTPENLLQPLEDIDDALARAWSPVGHLNGVLNSDELRGAYNACLGELSAYSTWTGQHAGLFNAYIELANGPGAASMTAAQKASVENALLDFRLAGVDLAESDQQRFGEIRKRLSELGARFSENVLDATDAWQKSVTEDDLQGLPETAIANARQAAENAGQEGLLLTLEFPSYLPVMTYCDNEAIRHEVYKAFCTRASDQGPHAGQWDNSEIIGEILDLRLELARLLGFSNYAEYSLATKMASTTGEVVEFLEELAGQSRTQAQTEWAELQQYARDQHGRTELQAWDAAYYGEKLRQEKFQVSQEEIRPYLPVERVLSGMFEVVQRLYGATVSEVSKFDSYHPDVRLFDIHQDGALIARFYLDLYARPNKRGGAWMDDCRVRRQRENAIQVPVAYLVCNFTPPVGDTPALLTESELTTLFHEFGHGLHHMLTQQTVAAVSGINGVPWDAVELPSQFFENWCWEPEALAIISGHYQTGEPLPQALLERMLAARNFQSGMQMVRQLEFALFDFRLHRDWGDGVDDVQGLLDQVRADVGVITPPSYNRFQHGFSHIFSGGYAAGYYSYKWAEVLSADAFSRFEEEGIFNADTGADFRRHILETGGSRKAMENFVAFRGRKPSIKPLLRHSGIAA